MYSPQMKLFVYEYPDLICIHCSDLISRYNIGTLIFSDFSR